MSTLTNNRWIAGDNDFATRIEVTDVAGFFSKSVLVEPGFRALFIEKGQSLGELPPGQHTLSNIVDRMKFWTQKTATVIVARQQDVRLELVCPGLLTSEFLEVEVALSITVRLEDVALFFANVMASKSAVSIDDIRQIVSPFLKQSLWEAVGRLSIKDLVGDQKRFDVESLTLQSLQTALTRYGLRLGTVETFSISHPEYDDQLRRTGQLWLQRQQLGFDQEAARLAADRLVAQIEQQEKSNDLAVLQKQVDTDLLEAEQVVRLRRIGVRREIRAAILANRFDQINNEEEMVKFVEQRDKERLIRAEELESLKAALRDKSADRDSTRAHLLRKLALEQAVDLESLRIDLNHQQRMKTRRFELELVSLNDSETSRQRAAAIQQETEDAERRRQTAHAELDNNLALARKSSSHQRTEELEQVFHEQKVARVRGEMTLETAMLTQKVALIELETSKARDLASYEMELRRKELEHEINTRENLSQMDRLRMVQELNLANMKAQQDMLLQANRQQHEFEERKAAIQSKSDLDQIQARSFAETARINAIKGASGFDVMAIAPDVAAHAADVLKTQATATATVAAANAQSVASQLTSEREKALFAQLTDSQRETLERATAAYQAAMQAQQGMFNQFGSTMEAVTKNLAPVAPQVIIPGVTPGAVAGGTSATTGSVGSRVVLCPKCRSENAETSRHCIRCGQEI